MADSGGIYDSINGDLSKIEGVTVCSSRYGMISNRLQGIFRILTSPRTKLIGKLPGKKYWCKKYLQYIDPTKPTCFIFWGLYDFLAEIQLFEYIKAVNPQNKCVLIFGDNEHVKFSGLKQITKENYRKFFDLILTYDKYLASEKNYLWYPTITVKERDYIRESEPLHDVFFIGKPKDRFSLIIKTYDVLEKEGIQNCFYLFGVKEKERVQRKGIVYLDKYMPYNQVLYHSINSKCILEITQQNVKGFTPRITEAVLYDKKLLTNNKIVKEIPFYDDKYIQFFEDPKEIDVDFIRNSKIPDFKYNDEWSPLHFLKILEENL